MIIKIRITAEPTEFQVDWECVNPELNAVLEKNPIKQTQG